MLTKPNKKNIFCKCGLHRPLYNHTYGFKDCVSGKTVYHAECSCGLLWMTDSLFGWFGDKVRRLLQKVDPHLEECKQKVRDIKFPRKKKNA